MLNTSKPPTKFRLFRAYPTDFDGASAFAWHVWYEADDVRGAEELSGNWNPKQLEKLKKQRDAALKSKKTSKNATEFFVDQWVFFSTLRSSADKSDDSIKLLGHFSRISHVAAALKNERS